MGWGEGDGGANLIEMPKGSGEREGGSGRGRALAAPVCVLSLQQGVVHYRVVLVPIQRTRSTQGNPIGFLSFALYWVSYDGHR